MLKEFKVKGFKNFNEEIIFELGDCNNYEFNKSAIKNGISKTALIYGKNGSGKSNLGYAIFDIVSHLTDKNRGDSSRYDLYLNLDSNHSGHHHQSFHGSEHGSTRLLYRLGV